MPEVTLSSGSIEDCFSANREGDTLVVKVVPGHRIGRTYITRDCILQCTDPTQKYFIEDIGQAGKNGVRIDADINHFELRNAHIRGWGEDGIREDRDRFSAKRFEIHDTFVSDNRKQGMRVTNTARSTPIVMRNVLLYKNGGATWPERNVADRNIYAERAMDLKNVLSVMGASEDQLRAGGVAEDYIIVGNALNIGYVSGAKDPIPGGVTFKGKRIAVLFPRIGRAYELGNLKSLEMDRIIGFMPDESDQRSRFWRLRGKGDAGGGIGIHNVRLSNIAADDEWDILAQTWGSVDSLVLQDFNEATVRRAVKSTDSYEVWDDYTTDVLEGNASLYDLTDDAIWDTFPQEQPEAPAPEIPAPPVPDTDVLRRLAALEGMAKAHAFIIEDQMNRVDGLADRLSGLYGAMDHTDTVKDVIIAALDSDPEAAKRMLAAANGGGE